MILGGDYAIHLHGDDGQLHSFLPGDALPEWAAARIDNPYTRTDTDTAVGDVEEAHEPEHGGMPPRKGPGASRQVWQEYATSRGIDVKEDWKREDIIAAVEAHV